SQAAHVHAVGIGFVVSLILGVALWLFPRAPTGDTRYRPGRVLFAYWILTLSTAGRFVLEVVRAVTDGWPVRAGLFYFSMWNRIRPVGSQIREAQGERF
ncbi:MAG: hypothetical protein MUO50_15320, partial [Longimicrobiales bacterium]|nr:hypothetical protein [Longimicrobiales bacterium]